MRPGDDETPDLEHLVIRLGKQLRHRRAASLEPFGLVAHQARAFLSVARAADRERELRPSHLAKRLRIAPRSATEVVDALEAKGLVARHPSPTDRRATQLLLTPAGEELRRELRRARADRDDAFACLSDREQATLRRLLTKVVDATDDGHHHH